MMRGLMLAFAAAAMILAATPLARADSISYRWVVAADGEASDYLAVVSAAAGSPDRERVVHKIPVGSVGNAPHSIGYTDDGAMLWVTGYRTNHIFIFDIRTDYTKPRLVRTIEDVVAQTGFSGLDGLWPSTQIPGQMTIHFAAGSDGAGSGGIAEFTNEGEFLAAAVSTEAYLGSCCPLFLLDSDTAAASADE